MDAAANSNHSTGLAVGIIGVIVFMAVVSYLFSRMRADSDDPPPLNPVRDSLPEQHPQRVLQGDGIQEDTVSKRNGPKKVACAKLDELREGQSGSDSTRSSCSICLGDYRDSDVLRLLPDCHHVFHRKCVDPWLQMHPTCPVCRSSPIPTPLAKVTPPFTEPRDQLDEM